MESDDGPIWTASPRLRIRRSTAHGCAVTRDLLLVPRSGRFRKPRYSDAVIRRLTRSATSKLVVWTGDDGPVPAETDAVGAEFRGRLGHPSSYGLLIARSADSPGVQIDLRPTSLAPRVPCDEVTLGLTEPEYAEAIHAAGLIPDKGLVVTGVCEGYIGSSVVVFTRLVAVVSLLLTTGPGPEALDDADLWTAWDEAWPSSRVTDS